MMVKIAPSLLAADFSNLKDEVASIESADWLHYDVMDGRFVPNISMGPAILKAVKKHSSLFADVHLMIDNPDAYLSDFVDAGAQRITVHAEACVHLHRTVQTIQSLGVKAGVAINPATSEETVRHILPFVDLVLVMTVNPGFGGQKFIPETLTKISRIKDMVASRVDAIHIQVDGGIDEVTAKQAVDAGATVLVAGTSIFSQLDRAQAIQSLRHAATK